MQDNTSDVSDWKNWDKLKIELIKRLSSPIKNPTFVFFFTICILVISPLSVWVELYNYFFDTKLDQILILKAAFVSFVPTFVASSCIPITWAASDQTIRSSAILYSVLILLVLLWCYSLSNAYGIIILGLLLVILSVLFWWVANSNQNDLSDDSDPSFQSTLGGEISGSMLPGDTKGYTLE